MADPAIRLTREERLAAKLRENLHRRKAQARDASKSAEALPNTLPLSKEPLDN